MILTKNKIKSFYTEAYITRNIKSNNLAEILIVFPTNRKLRSFKKKIVSHFSEKPISKFNIETLTTLTTKLLEQYNGFIPLSEAASTVLIKETTEKLTLDYFSSYTKGIPFGTLDRIKNVISEYKRHGITPETLDLEAEKLSGGEKNKAADISRIFKLYVEKCKKLNALEVGDIYSSINQLNENDLKKSFSVAFNDVKIIIFDGFDEFTQPEIKIINRLNEICKNGVIINFDYYSKNEHIFSHLDRTYEKLREYGFKSILDATPKDKFEFRNVLREKLFNSKSENKIDKYHDQISIIRASNKRKEIEIIAHTIKSEILKGSIEPHQICVVFNNIGTYSSIVRDIFGKYGLPLNLTDRIALKSSQPVIAAISLLELIENDFFFNDLMRVLSNKYLNFNEVDLNNIIFVANKLKIIRGFNNWKQQIDDAINLLKYDSNDYAEDKEQLEHKYIKARKDLININELLKPFKSKLNKSEFIINLKKLLLKLELPKTIIENTEGREEELIKSLTVFLKTIDEILLLVDNENPDKKYNLNYYLEQIRALSNWARFNVKEKSDQGILVTSVNEIRGLEFKYLFIGGMCDGHFPTKFSPEIFYSGSFQKKEQIHIREERYHFYQALSTWTEKLYLSFPQSDTNVQLVESTFLKEFKKLFSYEEINKISENSIYSYEEFLINYGKAYPNIDLLSKHLDEKLKEKINRKIETQKIRIDYTFDNNEFCGYIGEDNELKEYLDDYSKRQFSISQFETFAKCPFKYYCERIIKLEALDQPSDEIQPIELGNVLHNILFEFYSTIRKKGIELKPQNTKDFNRAKDILFNIAKTKIDNLGINSPITFFEKEKILGIDGVIENSILYQFLIHETENVDNFIPSYFELSFGNFREEEYKKPLLIENLKLRGKIDRIDINDDSHLFNIVDYKLRGRKPTKDDLNDGLSLQLPVYLMAAEELLAGKYKGYRMIIYSLDYNTDNFGKIVIKPEGKSNINDDEILSRNSELVNTTKKHLLKYHGKIKDGVFNLSELEKREEKVCRYCDYAALCRKEEIFD